MASTPPSNNPPWRQRLQERKVQTTSWIEQHSRPLSWVGVIVGGLCAIIAAWPLAITVWDFLGISEGQTWRLTLTGLGALALATGVWGVNRKRTPPVRLIWLILAAWVVATAAVTALTGFAWLLLETPSWTPPKELTPRHLEAITTRAFAIVAGLGGVALLVIAYRRQRTTEIGDKREVTKLFNERFTTAYTELGSENAAVRLGAVHALAHLADDAPSGKEVQMVIDVLCAYLRMPYTPAPEALPKNASGAQWEEHRERNLEFASFREVRHTIIRIIGNHLRDPTNWRGKDFDFTGTVFDGGNFRRANFTGGSVSFRGAKFNDGSTSFDECVFNDGKVSFAGAIFNGGSASFTSAEFHGGTISFTGTKFYRGKVSFDKAVFAGGDIKFDAAELNGGRIIFNGAKLRGSRIIFLLSDFKNGLLSFSGATISGGLTSFVSTEFTGAVISFSGSKFVNGEVSFLMTEFLRGEMGFQGSYFSGARVSFENSKFRGTDTTFKGAEFNSGHVDFSAASGVCPKNLLEELFRQGGSPNVVTLPDKWLGPTTPASNQEDPEEPL